MKFYCTDRNKFDNFKMPPCGWEKCNFENDITEYCEYRFSSVELKEHAGEIKNTKARVERAIKRMNYLEDQGKEDTPEFDKAHARMENGFMQFDDIMAIMAKKYDGRTY